MPPTTKKFAWKDRNTAGRDLLQLVYHAPPYISTLAIRLLSAIRSSLLLPELKTIFLDEAQLDWHRSYALRAFAETPDDVLVPELENITLETILNPRAKFRYHGDTFLGDVLGLVDKHPANRGWFFDVLDNVKDPKRLLELLQRWSYSDYSDDLQRLLSAKTLMLLDEHPHLVNLTIINRLTLHNMQYNQSWLDEHIQQIVGMCLAEVGSTTFRHIVQRWTGLADVLRESIDNFDDLGVYPNGYEQKMQETEPPKFLQSPAYQYLYQQYLDAADGDAYALKRLMQVSRMYYRNIPFRAVAVHFIGKLYTKYQVSLILYRQLCYANDDWGDELMPVSPVRYEAGEALLNLPSPETWETLIDSFFIAPRENLLNFQMNWIAYLTDVLGGESQKVYDGKRHNEPAKRSWFHALADISEAELQELTKNIR